MEVEITATISYRALASALLIALCVSYLVCIAADLLFGWTMYQVWAVLLPDFALLLTMGASLVGLLWLFGNSLYRAALLELPYNHIVQHGPAA